MTKEEIKIESKNISLTDKVDVQVYSEVVIDVSGEVIKVGVYKLKNGSRIEDVLIMAGGLNAKAIEIEWIKFK